MPHKKARKMDRAGGRVLTGSPRVVTLEVYNAGFQAYLKHPTLRSVMEATGLSDGTAMMLIHRAYPDKGMPAYEERLAQVRQEAVQQENYGIAQAQSEFILLARAARGGLIKKIQKMQQKNAAGDSEFESQSMKIKDLVDAIDRLGRFEMYLHGEDDMRIGVTGGDNSLVALGADFFRGWTREELADFAVTGRRPERFMSGYVEAAAVEPPKGDGK